MGLKTWVYRFVQGMAPTAGALPHDFDVRQLIARAKAQDSFMTFL
jgi:hypothetical protein